MSSSIKGWSKQSKKSDELKRLVNFFQNAEEREGEEGKVIGEEVDGIRFRNDIQRIPPDNTKPKIVGKWKRFDLNK